MYFFDYNLIDRLPSLTGLSKTEICAQMGLHPRSIYRWINQKSISVANFVQLCNLVRISAARFLRVSGQPDLTSKACVIDDSLWQEVEWHPEHIKYLWSEDNPRKVTKNSVVKRLKTTFFYIDRWTDDPQTLSMNKLLDLLNEYRLDARTFIVDRNENIPIPDWPMDEADRNALDERATSVIDRALNNVHELSRINRQQQKSLSKANTTIERLKKENESYRRMIHDGAAPQSYSDTLQEHPALARLGFIRRGYVFHKELYRSLPSLLEMTAQQFSTAAGVPICSLTEGNIANLPVNTLIRMCNILRMSITHFFPTSSEPLVVHDWGYYEIPERIFVPIQSRMENLRYLFGRSSVYGFTKQQLTDRTGVKYRMYRSASDKEEYSKFMVLTLAELCTQFNISPSVFLGDENKLHREVHSSSQNETLLLNAIDMSKTIEAQRLELRDMKAEVKRLRDELKEAKKD